MTRRTGFLLLGAALIVAACCAALVLRHIGARRTSAEPPPVVVEAAPPAVSQPTGPISTIIDLPGDPIIVHRGLSVTPRSIHVDLPVALAANAPAPSRKCRRLVVMGTLRIATSVEIPGS